ncbi:hypothetical protein JTE90_019066 [Oedothorax gibbosus]|uniref:Uncharacterized protein n=1 Tax=Oedothorax gibbosus TaxID=931172 RepID=A0AAV6UZS1_9ARAC|nr:hypothetical protein JTE90_019066 [Oedothorax gibbosus]
MRRFPDSKPDCQSNSPSDPDPASQGTVPIPGPLFLIRYPEKTGSFPTWCRWLDWESLDSPLVGVKLVEFCGVLEDVLDCFWWIVKEEFDGFVVMGLVDI